MSKRIRKDSEESKAQALNGQPLDIRRYQKNSVSHCPEIKEPHPGDGTHRRISHLEENPSMTLSNVPHPQPKLHHELQINESDALFLKRRLLCPGILEVDSTSEDEDEDISKIKVNPRRTYLDAERNPPSPVKEREKAKRRRKTNFQSKPIEANLHASKMFDSGEMTKAGRNTWEKLGILESVLLTREQLGMLLEEMGKHRTNDYICLIPTADFHSPHFDPYDLKVVREGNVGNRVHYTVSRKGVLLVRRGTAEFSPTLEFQRQIKIFDILKRIPFFAKFFVWKALKLWKSQVLQKKINRNKSSLADLHFICKRPLREMILEFREMIENISKLNLLKVTEKNSVGLAEFTQVQMEHLQETQKELGVFEMKVAKMTTAACRETLIEEGFSPDDYDQEMNFYLASLKIPLLDLDVGVNTEDLDLEKSKYPGEWLSFSSQRRKRQICKRISNFVRLIDIFVQESYTRVLKTSIYTLIMEMRLKMQRIPDSFKIEFKYQRTFDQLKLPLDSYFGVSKLSGGEDPIFEVQVSLSEEGFVISPSVGKFVEVFQGILWRWREAILSHENILSLASLHPYTQPIINGYLEPNACGEGPNLQRILDADEDIEGLRRMLELIIEHGFHVCQEYLKEFNWIRILCVENNTQDLDEFRKETNASTLKNWVEKFAAQESNVRKIEKVKDIGMFRVNNSSLQEVASPTIERCINVIRQTISITGGRLVFKCNERINNVNQMVQRYPETAEEYVGYLEYIDNVQKDIKNIEKDMENCWEIFQLIEECNIPCEKEDVEVFKQIPFTLGSLKDKIQEQLANRDEIVGELKDRFKVEMESILERLAVSRAVAESKEVLDSKSDAIQMLTGLNEVLQTLLKDQEKSFKFLAYQEKLKAPVSNFDELEKLIIFVKERKQLWELSVRLNGQKGVWMETPFHNLSPELMEKELNVFSGSLDELEKSLPPNDVICYLKSQMTQVRTQLFWIKQLHNPNIRQRHWDALNLRIGVDLSDKSRCLKDLTTFGIENHVEFIDRVVFEASSEFKLEAAVFKVENSWKHVEFRIISHKENGFILGGTEEIEDLLDDSLVNLTAIGSTSYGASVKHQVDDWVKRLELFSATLDELRSLQRRWMKFEFVFCAPDIHKTLPNEAKMFAHVENTWRETIGKIRKNKSAFKFLTRPGLLQTLKMSNELLDQIMKCLDDFLELKRSAFPRFYFLSNEELFEILGQEKNLEAIKPHIRKLFDGIDKLEFQRDPLHSKATEIVAMISPEGERVDFSKSIKTRGDVEDWLSNVEDGIYKSLKKIMRVCRHEWKSKTRTVEWILKFPTQCILTISQMMWARNIHAILDGNGNTAMELKEFQQNFTQSLEEIIAMVRGELPPLVRSILSALIIIEAHANDVLSNLVVKGVSASNEFEWVKQLRYYWEKEKEVVTLKISVAALTYRYEYLGASSRIVATPLTERAFISLTGALQMDFGGAVAGPTGTGKTETIRDLGKSLAVMLVELNCFNGMDYNTTSRFLSGLAQSGCWACFEHFDRIPQEMLSVIGQQMSSIKSAKVQKATRFFFEGKEIKLVRSCGIFITLNPGYAGRSQLPESLKSLFRPVSMMTPEVTLITEVILCSEAFLSYKPLATKVSQTFKMCSQLLSQQGHYDFGMRAVKSTLLRAGSLRRSNPMLNEYSSLAGALRDSISPQLADDDVPVFEGILHDLFPGVPAASEFGNGQLRQECVYSAEEKGLQPETRFIGKALQLFEMMKTRNGVILFGPTGGGKTSLYQVLASALSSLNNKSNFEQQDYFAPVEMHVLNPKAITMGELFGEFNPGTSEWRNGLLGIIFRNTMQPNVTCQKWVVCDGPIETEWVENLNSVLDDNQIFCLGNSERIRLPKTLRMIFESDDISGASPAIVSRCGIVFVDPNELETHNSYFLSWLNRTFSHRESAVKDYVRKLFVSYFNDGLNYIRLNCEEVLKQSVLGKVTMICSLLEALLVNTSLDVEQEEENSKLMETKICRVFVFAFIWSLGGNINEKHLEEFDNFVRNLFHKEENCRLPESGMLFDCFSDLETERIQRSPRFYPPISSSWSTTPFVDMLVPTTETAKFILVMQLLLKVGVAVMLTGPTGTGKSSIAKLALAGDKDLIPMVLNLSAQFTSKQVDSIFRDKLERGKRNVLRSCVGKKVIVFVDDLNRPNIFKQGAQHFQELLRQMIEFQGYYDSRTASWTKLEDLCFAAACCSQSAGGNSVPERLGRHFCVIGIPNPSEASLRNIYGPPLRSFLADFKTEVSEMSDCILIGVISVYQMMGKMFPPVPSKPHHVFSMRDISKCFQGIVQANKEAMVTKAQVVRLFCHECLRVFHDGLSTREERSDFCDMLADICNSVFNTLMAAEDLKGVVFADFMTAPFNGERNLYEEIVDKGKQTEILKKYMDEYNGESRNQLNLVFFPEAVELVFRIVRILRMELSNALLIGVGGIGKQSLTKLAAFICRQRLFQIKLKKEYDLSSFRYDLTRLYETAGMKNEPLVFLLTDTQIIHEEFLDDIHSILKTGEAATLLKPVDLKRMLSPIRAEVENSGIQDKTDIYDVFIRRVRRNLKIVLSMSPAGEKLRLRCRMFPSLISCCTINWFDDWPADALQSVASNIITTVDIGDCLLPSNMADAAVFIYESTRLMAGTYFEETGRRYFVTPSSFLDHMQLYSTMLKEQRDAILERKARIQNGLTKILETNEVVKQMRIELKDLDPLLVQKSQAVKEIMSSLAEDQAAADIVRRNVQMDEVTAKEKAFETQAIAEDAQKDLADALPALEAAVKSLDQLNKEDIDEIRQLLKPPDLVRTVMEAVCTLFGVKPDWNTSRQLLSDSNFLKKLYDFNKDGVPEKTLKNLKVYIENPKFTPKAVEKVSKACKSICLWVRAIDGYAKIFKTVEPKRKRYVTAQNELEQVMETLRRKTEQLNEVEKKIAVLRESFEGVMRERSDLEENMDVTAMRLKRAARLTKALASEQTRWAESVQTFDQMLSNIVGDIFIGTASIVYLGYFTSEYRTRLQDGWHIKCVELGLPCTLGYTVASLADASVVREWNAKGLPRDEFFTENAVLATKAIRWVLMIDPQEQAIQWIKTTEADNCLKIVKAGDDNLMNAVESCIRLGHPCLLEDVGDTLLPEMEPVLLKKTFTQGKTVMRLWEKTLDYNEGFRLFMTTRTANPEYSPEVCSQVALINFTITSTGLEDQLLSKVVSLESAELESQSAALLSQINSDKNQLVSLESKILRLLFLSEGNILDDEQLIQSLNNCKEASSEIGKRVSQAEVTEKNVSLAREKFRPVATRGCVLYFVVLQLPRLNQIYQFSLKYFLRVFTRCIGLSEKTEDQEERVKTLLREIVLATYINFSRGLFEEDKRIFSFMLCVDVLKSKNSISENEWKFFLRCEVGNENLKVLMESEDFKLSEDQENLLRDLESNCAVFKNIRNALDEGNVKIQIGTCEIHSCRNSELLTNEHWNKILNNFQKLVLIKILSREKFPAAITEFVTEEMGQDFIESPVVDLEGIHSELSAGRPLIFLLSKGSDPTDAFISFGKRMGFADRTSYICMGEEQGSVAEATIRSAMHSGDWVFLQNCHLSPCWFPRLELLVKRMTECSDKVQDTFRLYLSSKPTRNFPVFVLHGSEKVTVEAPKGIRANLRRTLVNMDKESFEGNVIGSTWKKMVFGISFFHAVVQERKKFGHAGWNIKYDFNEIDLECSILNMEMLCTKGNVPWDALDFVVGKIIYGGKVTDYWDQRCLSTILKLYFSQDSISQSHSFSASGIYYAPNFKRLTEYVDFVEKLPMLDEPAVFRMDENSNLKFQREERLRFFDRLLNFEGQQPCKKYVQDADQIVLEFANNLESKLPECLKLNGLKETSSNFNRLERDWPLQTFLKHEIKRFNSLLGVIRDSLDRLKKAVQGFVLISEEMEQMFNSFLICQVPFLWRVAAYASQKTLASWFEDFTLRFNFIRNWQTLLELPFSFWLSGFFFQQGFLTAVLQSHARKHDVPIEQLRFLFSVTSVMKKETVGLDPVAKCAFVKPDDGILVHGLFLEAARWHMELRTLVDSLPGEICTSMPILHFLPSLDEQPKKHVYTAPLYNTSERKSNNVTKMGNSSNFIEAIQLPSIAHGEQHWILQGTALLCQQAD